MEILLAFILSASSQPLPGMVEARAQARIRILRGHEASEKSWDPGANRNQREIVRYENDGSSVRLRLTEFE